MKTRESEPLSAPTVFEAKDGDHCIECHCATGDDWEFKDFSNKSIVICPQCKTEYNIPYN